MGPTNQALLQLFHADQALRAAQGRLDGASSSVRALERRIMDLDEQFKLAQAQLREKQAHAGQLDLDIKSRDQRIERLRTQQQAAKNLKEYQAFVTEINTEKLDKGKVEDELLATMEQIEKAQAQVSQLAAQLAAERDRCAQLRRDLGGRLSELQAEVERLRPLRAAAAEAVPAKARDLYERLAERYDGEAMSAVAKPNRRREEYICSACNMSLVADIYNRLHSRDDPVSCPNCHRLLFIPDDLPPELAINKPRERRERPVKTAPAAVARQVNAADVSRSIQVDSENEQAPAPPQETKPQEAAQDST